MALEQLGTPESPTLGLDTFGDRGTGPDGEQVSHAEAIRQVVAEGVLADELGVDFFGVGEHHRDDFAVSAPDVVLAAPAVPENRATGLRFHSGDDAALAAALLRLFSLGEPLRGAMGRRGRDWVLDHFNAAAVAEQTLRLYDDIAGRTQAPALTPRENQN